MWIVCLALFVICALLVSSLIIIDTLRVGISPMPTMPKVRKCVLKMLPRNLSGVVYELGCGFGFLALRLARRYPNAQIVAFETAIIPFLTAKILSLFVGNLEVVWKDFLTQDLTKADYLICYLFPGGMEKLAKMKLAGVMISHTFRLPGHKPNKVVCVNDLYKTQVYFYSLVQTSFSLSIPAK